MSNKEKIMQAETLPFRTISPVRRAADWLDEMVAKAAASQDGVVTEVIELTPALAEALIDTTTRNPDNRPIGQSVIERYRRDIREGRWRLNGQGLIVSRDGLLNDGQHRCWAVFEEGKPIRTLISFGVERSTRDTLDQGKQRSTADVLGMQGRDDTSALATAGAYLYQYETHGLLNAVGAYRPTRGQLIRMVEVNPDLVDAVSAVPRRHSNNFGGRGLLAFCWLLVSRVSNRPTADAFIAAIVTGAGLSAGDPILYVRGRLYDEKGRLKPGEKTELILRAWNANRRGLRGQRIAVLGRLPEIER